MPLDSIEPTYYVTNSPSFCSLSASRDNQPWSFTPRKTLTRWSKPPSSSRYEWNKNILYLVSSTTYFSKAQKNQQQKLEDALQEEDYDFGGREAVVPAEEGEGEEGDGLLAAETRNL